MQEYALHLRKTYIFNLYLLKHQRSSALYIKYMSFICILFNTYLIECLRFKLKYHPEESQKRKEEQIAALKVSRLILIFILICK